MSPFGTLRSRSSCLATAVWALLVVYGSLYPFQGWEIPAGGSWSALPVSWPARLPRSDLAANVLVYLPVGGLLCSCLRRRLGDTLSIALAAFAGASLSLALEVLQVLLPLRVPSLADVAANAAGALAGAVTVGSLGEGSQLGRRLISTRRAWLLPGRLTDLGLAALGIWAFSQLAPLVPSADLGDLKRGLRPLWRTLHDLSLFDPQQAARYLLAVAGLGILTLAMARPRRQVVLPYLCFVGAVLALKVPIVSRQLSLEALSGAAAAGVLLLLLGTRTSRRSWAPILGALVLLAAYLVEGLHGGPVTGHQAGARAMNWIPLRAHFTRFLPGLIDLVAGIWPFLAAGCLTRVASPGASRLPAALGGAILVLAVSFGVEWNQRTIAGRTPDMTDVLVAVGAWLVPWLAYFKAEEVGPPGSVTGC